MPIPSSYRLTSYLLLKCSLSPFGVPWNDCFVFNYYPPIGLTQQKKIIVSLWFFLSWPGHAVWQIASHSQLDFRRKPVATISPLWTQLASPGNVGRDQIQEVEYICLLGLSGSSLLFMFFGFSTIDCLILWRLMIACDLHVLNAPNGDDIWKCDITCAGGNGPAHVNFRLGSSRSKSR